MKADVDKTTIIWDAACAEINQQFNFHEAPVKDISKHETQIAQSNGNVSRELYLTAFPFFSGDVDDIRSYESEVAEEFSEVDAYMQFVYSILGASSQKRYIIRSRLRCLHRNSIQSS